MTETELKKLKRFELLEIMVQQGKEIESLKAVVAQQSAQLADRTIKIEKAGTIAEASFALNGILGAAEATAKQYLENIERLNNEQERICQEKIDETDARCAILEQETTAKCAALEQETTSRCATLEYETKNKVETLEKDTMMYCNELRAKTETECKELQETTKADCEKQIAAADDYYAETIMKTDAEVEKRWEELKGRLESFYDAHKGLRELLNLEGQINRL